MRRPEAARGPSLATAGRTARPGPEAASGGTPVCVSPGARFTSKSGVSAAVAVGLPVAQKIRASHPDNDYRLTYSVGRAF